MLLLNKREERIAVRGGGGHLYEKNTCYLHTEKHQELVVNTGKMQVI